MNEETKFELLGNFELRDGKEVCDLLEKHNIQFEVEIDDSSIRNMNPVVANMGGTWGAGVWANIYVPINLLEESISLLEETNN